jgi:SAM-dependent methyltransferase
MPACRSCGAALTETLVDLGEQPLANSYLDPDTPSEEERLYPLYARVCPNCLLVQVDEVVPAAEIFSDYAYFSSYSSSWVEHARRFAEEAAGEYGLGPDSLVVEVASNDGYLLRHFLAAGVPVLGIEPAANVAAVAQQSRIPTEVAFFGRSTAEALVSTGRRADLLVGNNVVAHVPDLNDFVDGLSTILAPKGVLSLEFPHVLNLIEGVQFDTIYHEHYCYFSLLSLEGVLRRHGLEVFDVVPLTTHGGSLRVLASHRSRVFPEGKGLKAVRSREASGGLAQMSTYRGFNEQVANCKQSLVDFLAAAAAEGHSVVGYGAAAKGNTLLNFCGVTVAELPFVVDRSPHKQGRLLPGSRIPVLAPDVLDENPPDYLLVLPWNLLDEIRREWAHLADRGTRFVVAIPDTRVIW